MKALALRYRDVLWAQWPAVSGNLVVGLTLALVTIPQAVAFSVTLAGVPPHFGIAAAIWGVLFCALLNPSRIFHGGPNNSMSAAIGVTLLPVAAPFGAEYMGYALTLGLMAGVIQMLFYLIRPLGRTLDLISEPVINGFICGIGLFLIFKSLTTFGGLPLNTEVEWPLMIAWHSLIAVVEIGNLYAIQVGLLTLVVCVAAQQFERLRNWAILIGVAAGTLYSQYLNVTLGAQTTLLEQIGNLSSIGFIAPSVPLFTQEAMPDIIAIVPGAVTLALLGLFQTVAAMRRMSRKTGGFTDSRSAIFSDAVSNCLLPFLSSLPTCASFNRMWLVHRLGIHSRIAIVISALWVLLLVIFFAGAIAVIPMPAMAAVIMLLGANMIKWEDIRPHFRHRGETVVFLGSFLSVIFLDLFEAVIFGSILAIAYAKWEQAHPNVSLQGNVLKIRGNIYYGSLPVIEALYHRAIAQVDELVIDFSEAYYIDQEGIRWLAAAKAARKAGFVDRRGSERRESMDRRELARAEAGDRRTQERREARGRRRRDRRHRAEF
ncbi:MAG TPA: SulP family inorganic anion transporter [Burkholderiales bacterium]|nr:SulP family inorganic anion transporter [Burkholderiales bacterium]